MKYLLKYIDALFDKYQCEQVTNKGFIRMLEIYIELYIENNYEDIRKQKYVSFILDKNTHRLQTCISSTFRTELETHYPEKLI